MTLLYFFAAVLLFCFYAVLDRKIKDRAAAEELRNRAPQGYLPAFLIPITMRPLIQNGDRIFVEAHLHIEALRKEPATAIINQFTPVAQEKISLWALTFQDQAAASTPAAYHSLKRELMLSTDSAAVKTASITAIAPIKQNADSPLQQLERDVLAYRQLHAFKEKYQNDPFLSELVERKVEAGKLSLLDPGL